MDEGQAGEPVTTAGERVDGNELREATFPQALRGYDREAVHAFLDRVADWVEGNAGAIAQSAPPHIRTELEKVGERTAGILTAAEEAAAKLRAEAEEQTAKLQESAEEEARRVRLNAGQRADELIAEAEAKAEKIIDDALARRRRLNQAITSLAERRDEIAGEAQRLGQELLESVEALRSGATPAEPEEQEAVTPIEEAEPPLDESENGVPPRRFDPADAIEETELEPPDQRETAIHDTR
jgi:cell division initiation protein